MAGPSAPSNGLIRRSPFTESTSQALNGSSYGGLPLSLPYGNGGFVPTQVVQCGLFCLRKGPNKHMNERPELGGEKPVLNVAFWVIVKVMSSSTEFLGHQSWMLYAAHQESYPLD